MVYVFPCRVPVIRFRRFKLANVQYQDRGRENSGKAQSGSEPRVSRSQPVERSNSVAMGSIWIARVVPGVKCGAKKWSCRNDVGTGVHREVWHNLLDLVSLSVSGPSLSKVPAASVHETPDHAAAGHGLWDDPDSRRTPSQHHPCLGG